MPMKNNVLPMSIDLYRPPGGDNVVRKRNVTDPDCDDERVQGVREFISLMENNPRLTVTALQTVGIKGWDGFTLARVNA